MPNQHPSTPLRAAAESSQLAAKTTSKRRKLSPDGDTTDLVPPSRSWPSVRPRWQPRSKFYRRSSSHSPPKSYVPAHLNGGHIRSQSICGRSPTPATATANLTISSEHTDMQSSPQDGDSATNAGSRSPSPGSKRAASEITDCDPEGGVAMTVEDDDASNRINDQVAQVSALMTRPLRNGQKGYVVSMKWLKKFFARTSTHADRADKESQESDLGPVDNSDLALDIGPDDAELKDEDGQQFVPMRPGLNRGDDYEIVPIEAWDLIMKWYGLASGTPIITRFAHDTSPYAQPNFEYNVNPPIVTIFKLSNPYAGMTPQLLREKNLPSVKLLASSETNFMKWLKMAKLKAGIDMATKVRVWKIHGGIPSANPSSATTPVVSRAPSPLPPFTCSTHTTLLVDLNTFLNLSEGTQREALHQIKDQTNNSNYNGKMTLKMAGLVEVNTLVLDEQVGKGEWASEVSAKALKKLGIPIEMPGKKDTLGPNDTPVPFIGPAAPSTLMRQPSTGKKRPSKLKLKPSGLAGLTNLGNTCYMNAATQCIRGVEELSIYFLSKKYKDDLNYDNVLGHAGRMAKAYAELMDQMYAKREGDFCVTPRRWKAQVGQSNHTFTGFSQHDSQEFLMFALDALSEDLDRIQKKPYIEKPDSTDEMVHDRQALEEFAKQSWDIYKARNDSVITDLFAGMYKSTLVCPTCDKVSIMFDPFSSLTLPIPMEAPISFREIIFMPINSRPTRRIIEVNRTQSMAEFIESVSAKTGVPSNRLIAANVSKSSFWRIYDELDMSFDAARIQQSDVITVMELDTPASDERILVSLFHRAIRGEDKSKGTVERNMFACPAIISFTPQEARDLEAIYRKVLKHVATMTTLDILNENGNHGLYDPIPDDSEVQESENEGPPPPPPHPLESSIAPFLLDFFDVKYMSTKEQIPRGRLIDTVKNYPLLTSRLQPSRNNSENSSADDSETRSVSDRSDSSTLPEQKLPFIKQGEALLLDWSNGARMQLFTTSIQGSDRKRGEPTYVDPKSVHDPEIVARRAEIAQRKTKAIDLHDCLQEFGKTEVLSVTDAWHCPRCKKHVQARKKFELWSAPDILVVHLKRFAQGASSRGYMGGSGNKLKDLIDFPLENLDLSSYVAGPSGDKSLEYDLFAVDYHTGAMNYGHYYTFAKNWIDGEWYEFNDNLVQKAKKPQKPLESSIVTQFAYLLFYRRKSAGPLGGPELAKIVTSYLNREVEESQSEPEAEAESWSGSGSESESEPEHDPDHDFSVVGDLFGDNDSTAAVGEDGSEAGDRLQELEGLGQGEGEGEVEGPSFEDVPPLLEEGSDEDLPVVELHVGEE